MSPPKNLERPATSRPFGCQILKCEGQLCVLVFRLGALGLNTQSYSAGDLLNDPELGTLERWSGSGPLIGASENAYIGA